MDISTDVLYDLLSQHYTLDRFGKGMPAKSLSLPVFYNRSTACEQGRVYIARTSDLPSKPVSGCLFICIGTRPPKVWNMWPGEVIYVSDAHDDIIGVFNTVQHIFDTLIQWGMYMQDLVSSHARIPDLVEASIPIFENRITITDYELRILAYCELVEDGNDRYMTMSDRFARVPPEKTPAFSGKLTRAMRNREPFFVEEKGRGDNYCINLFLGESYMGCCSLQEDLHPLRTSDLELFQIFAGFVRQSMADSAKTTHGQLTTLKSVLSQLLNCFPVSQADMRHALDFTAFNLDSDGLAEYKWCCVVIQSANHGKELPEGYLTSTVEDILPNALALVFEDSIVTFCLLKRDEHRIDMICDPLDAYLRDMNFRAGISRTFRNLFHARDFYLQAICAIDTGFQNDPHRSWFLFGDYVADYMLSNCCGDFDPKMIVAPELIRLRNISSAGVDYLDTLRAYLDNDCNASQTAKAMYLHRSTLVQRLDRIREIVDLEMPERRLYLRMCLHLPDVDWDALSDADIEDFG